MKKTYKTILFFILSFVVAFCFSCSKKNVFQQIDLYITKKNSYVPILSTWNFDFFGTKVYNDNKIHCNYKGQRTENFILTIPESYRENGIYFSYSLYSIDDNTISSMLSPSLIFYGEGKIFQENYNLNNRIDFQSSNIPTKYYERVLVLFDSFLETLNNYILKECDLTLKDFGYYQ